MPSAEGPTEDPGCHTGHFNDVTRRLEGRVGRIPIVGRYHRLPCKIEDDYIITDKVLGTGDTSSVLLASRRGCDSAPKFAIKTYALDTLEPKKMGLLLSEVETFLYVDHPHIARLYGVYESKESLHFVMESMEGGQLFDRFRRRGRFPEPLAADTVSQILLALNYIHLHGIVHRDVKLENFVYDRECSGSLKLIDFGFSKMFDSSMKMKKTFGTMLYVAPEVLSKSYTCQCDLWSLGVLAFVIIADYFPFSGDDLQTSIQAGSYNWRPDMWCNVSEDAADFVRRLLVVDPSARLTAQDALEHRWIKTRWRSSDTGTDPGIVAALRTFSYTPKFRRCCMEMLAWSLSNDDRAKVRDQFLSMDSRGRGTITLEQLKATMTSTLRIPDDEVQRIFSILDGNKDSEIAYSEFLAAMVSTHIELQSLPIQTVFRKFDMDKTGYITANNLRDLLGDSCQGDAEAWLGDANLDADGRLSFTEFSAYLHREVSAPAIVAHRSESPVLRAASFLMRLLRHSALQCCGRSPPEG